MSRGKKTPLTNQRLAQGMPSMAGVLDLWQRAHKVPSNDEIIELLNRPDGVAIWNSWRLRAAAKEHLAEMEISSLVLKDVDLRQIDLRQIRLVGLTFENVNLRGALLEDVELQSSYFATCDLSEINFNTTNFNGVKLNDCDLSFSNFATNIWTNVEFNRCNFMISRFSNNIMALARFFKADFRESVFLGDDIENTMFDQCNWGVIGSSGEVRQLHPPMNWTKVSVERIDEQTVLPSWLQEKIADNKF